MHSNGTADYDLRLTSRRTDHALIITVSGDIDLDTVEPLQYALSAAHCDPDRSRTVVLDLSAVSFAGTSFINVLLRARNLLGAERLRITDPSLCVARLMRMTDLDRYFTIDTTMAFASTAATTT